MNLDVRGGGLAARRGRLTAGRGRGAARRSGLAAGRSGMVDRRAFDRSTIRRAALRRAALGRRTVRRAAVIVVVTLRLATSTAVAGKRAAADDRQHQRERGRTNHRQKLTAHQILLRGTRVETPLTPHMYTVRPLVSRTDGPHRAGSLPRHHSGVNASSGRCAGCRISGSFAKSNKKLLILTSISASSIQAAAHRPDIAQFLLPPHNPIGIAPILMAVSVRRRLCTTIRALARGVAFDSWNLSRFCQARRTCNFPLIYCGRAADLARISCLP